jgi:ATP-dependent protease ClpP protease subunit
MNDELLDMLTGQDKKRTHFHPRPVANVHEFYLSGEIKRSEEYIDWFDAIRNCGPNDVINIHINSYGGDLFTAIQMIRVLGECPGTVITSVEGACMSAATMIFLCADGYEVSGHSMFMFHNYSGGTIGKGGEMYDNIIHERKWSEKLLRDIYADFLTEDEIESILNNKDIWMDGEEVIKRLELKKEKVNEVAEKPKPKPRQRRKKNV